MDIFLSNIFKFLLKFVFFFIKNFETENLYKINKELTSNKKIKVYKLFDKYKIGINIIKLNQAKKKSILKFILLFFINFNKFKIKKLKKKIKKKILIKKLFIFKWLNKNKLK